MGRRKKVATATVDSAEKKPRKRRSKKIEGEVPTTLENVTFPSIGVLADTIIKHLQKRFETKQAIGFELLAHTSSKYVLKFGIDEHEFTAHVEYVPGKFLNNTSGIGFKLVSLF